MAVFRKGHIPALHRGHCSNLVKYFFTVLEASQGGLVMSRLHMTCWRLLRNTDVALPCDIMNTQQLMFTWFGYTAGISNYSRPAIIPGVCKVFGLWMFAHNGLIWSILYFVNIFSYSIDKTIVCLN